MSRNLGVRRAGLLALFILGASTVYSQITSVGNDTSTPVAGVGHDYRQLLSETVSPANGSLSVRIGVPTPGGRGMPIPFSFNYDSAGVHHVSVVGRFGTTWLSGSGYLNSGGWSYGIPVITSVPLTTSPDSGVTTCTGETGFVFTNPQGERHSFPLFTWLTGSYLCNSGSPSTDGPYLIQPHNTGQVIVSDRDGTVFRFESPAHTAASGQPASNTYLSTTIEDRNGNITSVADTGNGQFTITDAADRAVISSTGFGTSGVTYNLNVTGLAPYQVKWGSATSNYSVGSTQVAGNACTSISPQNGTQPVITDIILPNGQTYHFDYDSQYGLLNKVTYPDGGYSRYTWGLNLRSDPLNWPSTGVYQGKYYCNVTMDTPAVTSRFVSFDGINEILEEDYNSYTTNWTNGSGVAAWGSKSTNVLTTLKALSTSGSLQNLGSFNTNYTFSSIAAVKNPYQFADVAEQIPVEQSIVYYNFDGSMLRTIAKLWADQFSMSSQTTTLDTGVSAATTYTYYANDILHEKIESDFGGAPLRKTSFNYQAFPATAIFPNVPSILDRACQVITYDSSMTNRVAETDYYYDGGTSLCGSPGTPSVSGVSGLTGHDEVNYYATSASSRGNLTKKVDQILPGSTTAPTSFAYDETGYITSEIDANTNKTSFSYADNYKTGTGTPPGQTNTYLTTLTLPATTTSGKTINHVETFTYQYSDGQLSSSTDQNTPSNTTSYSYNDPLDRLVETDYPDGGKTIRVYTDARSAATPNTTVSSYTDAVLLVASPASSMTTNTILDGVGHITQTQLTSDPWGATDVLRTYDGLGRPYSVSNPYRPSNASFNAVVNTAYKYDALGRATSTTEQDGSMVAASYLGQQTTTTDETGRQRKATSDALGRLVQVVEDPGSPVCSATVTSACHLNYTTSYGYNTLDGLISVTQGVGQTTQETRSFAYDSLKRLIAANNPENATTKNPASLTCTGTLSGTVWTACYSYDGDSNLLTKLDNLNVQTSYTYDALNRPLTKSYTGSTASVTYSYDISSIPNSNPIGHLTSVSNNNSTTTYSVFDTMGRVTASSQTTQGVTYPFASYTYNLAGALTSEAFPSGRTVTTNYDADNRPIWLQGRINGATKNYIGNPAQFTGGGDFADQIQYVPHGAVWAYTRGDNITRAEEYNARLQSIESYYSLNNTNDAAHMLFVSCPHWGSANVVNLLFHICPTGPSASNNGNLVAYDEYLGASGASGYTTFSQPAASGGTIAYDGVNRLTNISDTGGWSRTFAYDTFGNMSVAAATGMLPLNNNTPQGSNPATIYNTNNQVVGQSYTAVGNLTTILSAPNITLAYDAENRQISAGGYSYGYDGNGRRVTKTFGGSTTVYVYDAAGELAAEYNTAPVQTAPACATCYLSYDHLRSVRLVTNGANGAVVSRHDYLPFGEEATTAVRPAPLGFQGTDFVTQRFTGKERDSESGLDYFGARYYGSALGRFASPDWSAKPMPIPYATLSNPQTLNLYGYIRNNPLGGADADGHCDWCQKLWNGLTGNGWQTDAQIAAKVNASVTVTQTFSLKNPDQTTTVSADLTHGVVVQAGFSIPNFSSESPSSLGFGLSYVPSSGDVFATGSLGTPGSGVYVVAGLTTNQDQSGPSLSGAAFGAGIGGTVSLSLDPTSLKPNGDATFGVGFGTSGSSGLSYGGTTLFGSVAPTRANVSITAAPPNSTPIGEGLYTWEDWPHL